MDTVRIGFFLGELYGLLCCACDIRKSFLYGKIKEKVYITAGPEVRENLRDKNLLIDKSLYGSKTFAARFHGNLSEVHDLDLWMVDNSSHYEYLATYVSDILIWNKDPVAILKSFEKLRF
jgi:hypothetical protein